MMLKTSFYNEIIPIAETNEFLLYNIFSGGLSVLQESMGTLLTRLSAQNSFSIDDYDDHRQELQRLYDQGFLVDVEMDEAQQYRLQYDLAQQAKYRGSSDIGITIGTTILCNMGCPYCFETVKPNKTLRDESVQKAIVHYIEDMINRAPVRQWNSMTVAWYGGEPLINKDAIEILSKGLLALSDRYSIPYDASIITNGLLLDAETWQFLKANRVSSVQVTIDGAKEVHDRYRPLKAAQGRNYEKILEHLTMLPEGMQLTIRINTDKRVAASLPQLLDDLYAYGLWPQRHKAVSLSLAWLRPYDGADVSKMVQLTQDEYFDVSNQFIRMKLDRYNAWAAENAAELGRLKWHTPSQQSDCATFVSPYFFTFDPDGNIHKCWETIHDDKKGSGANVFQPWNEADFNHYTQYARTQVHPVCAACKFNPVCEGLSCAHDALHDIKEDHFPCTPWKKNLGRYFKEMYLEMREHPDRVVFKSDKEKAHQTHANK